MPVRNKPLSAGAGRTKEVVEVGQKQKQNVLRIYLGDLAWIWDSNLNSLGGGETPNKEININLAILLEQLAEAAMDP